MYWASLCLPFSSSGSVTDSRTSRTWEWASKSFLLNRSTTLPASFEEAFTQERDVTEENIQARIRGNILMAYSNKYGYLLPSTGNKSEMAVGYCTFMGI